MIALSRPGGAVVEHEVQAEEEEPVPGGAGARAAGEERAPAQERARRPQRVAQEAHREPLPEQGREGGARQEAGHHTAAGQWQLELVDCYVGVCIWGH